MDDSECIEVEAAPLTGPFVFIFDASAAIIQYRINNQLLISKIKSPGRTEEHTDGYRP